MTTHDLQTFFENTPKTLILCLTCSAFHDRIVLMSRKDYEMLAAVLAYTRPGQTIDPNGYAVWARSLDEMCARLRADNARFNVAKFRAACGA